MFRLENRWTNFGNLKLWCILAQQPSTSVHIATGTSKDVLFGKKKASKVLNHLKKLDIKHNRLDFATNWCVCDKSPRGIASDTSSRKRKSFSHQLPIFSPLITLVIYCAFEEPKSGILSQSNSKHKCGTMCAWVSHPVRSCFPSWNGNSQCVNAGNWRQNVTFHESMLSRPLVAIKYEESLKRSFLVSVYYKSISKTPLKNGFHISFQILTLIQKSFQIRKSFQIPPKNYAFKKNQTKIKI